MLYRGEGGETVEPSPGSAEPSPTSAEPSPESVEPRPTNEEPSPECWIPLRFELVVQTSGSWGSVAKLVRLHAEEQIVFFRSPVETISLSWCKGN